MRLGYLVALGALITVVAPSLATAGPGLIVGAVEDDVRASSLVEAEARMTTFRISGFRAVRVTSYWTPGLTSPSDEELRILRNVSDAARRNGVRVYVTVMNPGSRTTPLTDEARAEFASYAAAIIRQAPSVEHVIIGNEPNLNRFWLPQFALDGTSVAPAVPPTAISCSRMLFVISMSAAPVRVLPGPRLRFEMVEAPRAPTSSSARALDPPVVIWLPPVVTSPSTVCTPPKSVTSTSVVMQATSSAPGTPSGTQLDGVTQLPPGPVQVFVQSLGV